MPKRTQRREEGLKVPSIVEVGASAYLFANIIWKTEILTILT
ncbi:hypothetical protein [Brevibacillus reuszeri]|nr:hypothetical protein [Brevibacillus reuszeri]